MMQLNVTPDFKKRSLKFGPEFPAAAKLESVELVIPNPDGKIKTAGLSFIILRAVLILKTGGETWRIF